MKDKIVWICGIVGVVLVAWFVTNAVVQNKRTELEQTKIEQQEQTERIIEEQEQATKRTHERWGFLPWSMFRSK